MIYVLLHCMHVQMPHSNCAVSARANLLHPDGSNSLLADAGVSCCASLTGREQGLMIEGITITYLKIHSVIHGRYKSARPMKFDRPTIPKRKYLLELAVDESQAILWAQTNLASVESAPEWKGTSGHSPAAKSLQETASIFRGSLWEHGFFKQSWKIGRRLLLVD